MSGQSYGFCAIRDVSNQNGQKMNRHRPGPAGLDDKAQSRLDAARAFGIHAIVVTLAYALAMIVTFHLLMPVQVALFPEYESYASLFYLPHTVRVLAAWWFGWLSIPLLLPAVALEVFHLYGTDASLTDLFAASFTAVGPALSFWLLAKFGFDARARRGRPTRWPDLVAVGAFASVVGIIGPGLIYANSFVTLAAWFLGDMTGMLLLFLPMQALFRRVGT